MFAHFRRYLTHGLCFTIKKIAKHTYNIDFNIFFVTSNSYNNIKNQKCNRIHRETYLLGMNNAHVLKFFFKKDSCYICSKIKSYVTMFQTIF